MRVTATEAKSRFGSLCALAKHEPAFVEKAGELDTVISSAGHYQALQAHHDKAPRAARKKAFELEFRDWIAAEERQAAFFAFIRMPVSNRTGGHPGGVFA